MKVKNYPWSDDFFKTFEKSLNDDKETLKKQVVSGRAQVWRFSDESVDIWTILRREARTDGDELIVCCAEGKGLKKVIPVIESIAKKWGMVSARFHTLRSGLERMSGYELAEMVYRKKL